MEREVIDRKIDRVLIAQIRVFGGLTYEMNERGIRTASFVIQFSIWKNLK